MKILLANKFYYPRGGDCLYVIELEKLLRARGHDVAVFAMEHPESLDSPWRRFFPGEVNFLRRDLSGAPDRFARPLGAPEVTRKFDALLDAFQPDLVHLNNIHSHLSPVIARQAYRRGLPVFWTLHDYKLLCPRYDCMRDGHIVCDLCSRRKSSVIRHRCIKNSLGASLLAYLEALRWSRWRLQGWTTHFICPSAYLRDRMVQGGWRADRLTVLPNFSGAGQPARPPAAGSGYYCYVGRLSKEKGVRTLVRAAAQLDHPLKVVGDGPLLEELRAMSGRAPIELLGRRGREEVLDILACARFSVMPSECCENSPLSLIESLCLGTPVLGANIGGIPELVRPGENGRLFESGNAEDLKAGIQALFGAPGSRREDIAGDALRKHSPDAYYDALMALYARR